MLRQITVDEDTLVGYDFPTESYYVTNKETTTSRPTEDEILSVLKIVNPSLLDEEGNLITKARLTALATTYETLESLSYTLADTGEYIHTIQLNSYSSNPLTIDLSKGKIYIMNTNLVYDLSLNEAPITRVRFIKDYYKRHLGLDVEESDLLILYNLLANFYTPHPYNTIVTPTTQNPILTYSNTMSFSNSNSASTVTYSLLGNPNSLYSYTINNYITDINSNRVMKLLNTPTSLAIGDTIYVDNATTVVDENTSYTANGTYTISTIEDNLIKVEETTTPFSTSYKTCYLKQPIMSLSSVDRNTRTLTLTSSVPNSILVGDTLYITGTTQVINYQNVSIDGEYTVYSVTGSTIVTEETPSTNYTHSTTYGEVSKHVDLGNILSIKDKVITIADSLVTSITGLKIVIDDTVYTVTNSTTNTITVSEDIEDYTPPYATLELPVPSENTKATVLTSDKEQLPTGEFILDTYQETIDYLKLGTTIVPTLTNFNNFNKEVPTTYTVEGCTVATMTLKGLYSKVYTDQTT